MTQAIPKLHQNINIEIMSVIITLLGFPGLAQFQVGLLRQAQLLRMTEKGLSVGDLLKKESDS